MCDFWARIRIRKSTLERLVESLVESIAVCSNNDSIGIEEALEEYWLLMGVRNRNRLCEEEPDLCEKMQIAEQRAIAHLVVARHQ